jgi:hypothetical protein
MQARTEEAIGLMMQFAARTGLVGDRPQRRYLWTDAFAVCNFLCFARATRDARYTKLALELVHQVHHVLGRHRDDDRRTGWISGLADGLGEFHPTCGGLRIGKPLPERRPDQPVDDSLEWDRDGQYFHYLTKWMHALDQVTRQTGQPMFSGWARELAYAAHRAFTYRPRGGGGPRMYWKLSIDLSRPLVGSMGQHDPLDGLITCLQLEATAGAREPHLDAAIADFAAMIDPRRLATRDPLGLGGLLADAYRVTQLGAAASEEGLVEALLAAALAGIRHYAHETDLRMPADGRLAFRELGLAIGLAAIEGNAWHGASQAVREWVDQLARYLPLRSEIESFWLQPTHRRATSWLRHADINDVMLATSLRPEGYLVLSPQPAC